MEIEKRFINAEVLFTESFHLASLVFESDFHPTWILAVWRGGAPVGMCIHEFLKVKGIKTDHIPIRTSSYTAIGTQSATVAVHGLEYFIKNANADDRVLIVDDILDTGLSMQAILDKIRRKMRLNTPKQIRIATVFNKPKNRKVDIKPDYYCQETDMWIVFPHELEGLSLGEIREKKYYEYSF